MSYLLTQENAKELTYCFGRHNLVDLVPVEGLTPQELNGLSIPLMDRYWALVLLCGVPDDVLIAHAVWCGEKALEQDDKPDVRTEAALEVTQDFLDGLPVFDAVKETLEDAWEAYTEAREAVDLVWVAYEKVSEAYGPLFTVTEEVDKVLERKGIMESVRSVLFNHYCEARTLESAAYAAKAIHCLGGLMLPNQKEDPTRIGPKAPSRITDVTFVVLSVAENLAKAMASDVHKGYEQEGGFVEGRIARAHEDDMWEPQMANLLSRIS